MSDTSPRLSLPYILPSQAQKHVTHNEAIKVLDAITQLAVQSASLTEPPSVPLAGECHLVGPAAVGAWAARDGQIAVFNGTGWAYFAPAQGWRADVAPEGRSLRFNGTAWVDATVFQNLESLGIATTADTVNRLAVASEASLFTHQGNGHQVKINKSAAAETASVMFQTGWSGRAEMGTIGSDNFGFKVSTDGEDFHAAIELEAATGAVRFPQGQSFFRDVMISDDTAHAFDIPWSNPARILLWIGVDLPGHGWLLSVTGPLVGASNMIALAGAPTGGLHLLTGALTGATVPDGSIGLAIDASGENPVMHLENRLGAGRRFTLATLGR